MVISAVAVIVVALVFVTLITSHNAPVSDNKELAHEKKWGIYVLDLESNDTELVYSSADTISPFAANQTNSSSEKPSANILFKPNTVPAAGAALLPNPLPGTIPL